MLFPDSLAYGAMLILWMVPLLSVFLRGITSSGPKIWEVAMFMTFAFAIT